MNTLMDLNASTDGLPVACIIRGVLAKSNGDNALPILRSVPSCFRSKSIHWHYR